MKEISKKKIVKLLKRASEELSNQGRQHRSHGGTSRMNECFDMADAIDYAVKEVERNEATN